jgi:D-amino-acid oxidase
VLSPEELPEGIDSGTEHTSVCINTALYLPYLVGQCRKHGVVLERRVLSHVAEAGKAHPSGQEADVVINCTGLLASRLGGVNDKTVVPARGQTIIVRNSPGYMYGSTSMEDKEDELAYCMERASGIILSPPDF